VRVPVGVVDDDCVSGIQVDTETPGPGRQQEAKLFGAFLVEAINRFLDERNNSIYKMS
jgi:hypothetical protein